MTGDWNPVTAFHQLSVLSQVAQYCRHWKVIMYVPPMPDYSSIINADPWRITLRQLRQ
jgi:hypothetical protein